MISKPIRIVSTNDQDYLEVRWNPTNVCNFSCRYCFPESNEGTHNSPENLDLVIKNFNHFLKQYREKLGKTKFHLKLGGGEPTLWKGLEYFISEIKKENNVYVSLISNGSRTLRWWKQNGHLIDNVTLSYHVAQANVEHHIDVADTMFELGKKVTVSVLMDPDNWNKAVNDIEYMKAYSKYKWFIQTTEVIEPTHMALNSIKIITKEERRYTSDQKKYMRWSLKRIPGVLWFIRNIRSLKKDIKLWESRAVLDNGSILKARSQTYINNNWNAFKGWECNLGIESLMINWDGNIVGACGQTLYGLDTSFNILDKDFVKKFNPIFKPVICGINNCFCQPETHISKFRFS